MSTKIGIGATALLLSLMTTDQAFAGYIPVFPVPEFDGSTGIAAMSLLVSIGAVLFSRSRK